MFYGYRMVVETVELEDPSYEIIAPRGYRLTMFADDAGGPINSALENGYLYLGLAVRHNANQSTEIGNLLRVDAVDLVQEPHEDRSRVVVAGRIMGDMQSFRGTADDVLELYQPCPSCDDEMAYKSKFIEEEDCYPCQREKVAFEVEWINAHLDAANVSSCSR